MSSHTPKFLQIVNVFGDQALSRKYSPLSSMQWQRIPENQWQLDVKYWFTPDPHRPPNALRRHRHHLSRLSICRNLQRRSLLLNYRHPLSRHGRPRMLRHPQTPKRRRHVLLPRVVHKRADRAAVPSARAARARHLERRERLGVMGLEGLENPPAGWFGHAADC